MHGIEIQSLTGPVVKIRSTHHIVPTVGNILYTEDFDRDDANSKYDGERGGILVVPVNLHHHSGRMTGAMDPKINETRTMEDAHGLVVGGRRGRVDFSHCHCFCLWSAAELWDQSQQ